MQDVVDDEKGIATCILCGKPLKGLQVVKYRDWHAHAECAQAALKRQVDDFDRIPFVIGIIGTIIGILVCLPLVFVPNASQDPIAFLIGLLSLTSAVTDPTIYWIAFAGIGISLLLQSFGLYGFAKNYDEGVGRICAVIAIVNGLLYFGTSFILVQFGYNPTYYDPETGFLMFDMLPDFLFALLSAHLILLILMVMIAVMILLLGESITFGFNNRIIAFIFIASGAALVFAPLNFLTETILMLLLFMTARIPKEWSKITAT